MFHEVSIVGLDRFVRVTGEVRHPTGQRRIAAGRRRAAFVGKTPDAGGAQFTKLLTALGFMPVATVRKQRRSFEIDFASRAIEGALDEVEGLGTFVELETLADDAELDAAQRAIRAVADELQLGSAERRSYLELLLEELS